MILQTLAVALCIVGLMVFIDAEHAIWNQRRPEPWPVSLAGMLGVAFLIALLYAGGEL